MIILPAIDIKDGNCVRLFKGDYSTVEKVCDTPYKAAEQFKAAGAQYMHMVDLDGAKDATLANADLIIDVAKQSGLKVEVGGGIRDMAARLSVTKLWLALTLKTVWFVPRVGLTSRKSTT